MDRIFIDEETGESMIEPLFNDVNRNFINRVNNVETGEPEIDVYSSTTRSRKVPFQIPKQEKEKRSKNRNGLMDVEPVPVGASFGEINPICLFLSAIVYFRWLLALIMIFEVAFHIWAHHKNKALKDASVYFRSPFHAISAEFCALCQNETCMNRIGKFQQIRMHKFLRSCNYMKRVVT
ncbi:uncharacterized protein [Prorops nasuta]|uniref:uncharacterized protein n=1 Tax=Prorops nasuta TaxID=863751 RepID=UPI0034CDD9E3